LFDQSRLQGSLYLLFVGLQLDGDGERKEKEM